MKETTMQSDLIARTARMMFCALLVAISTAAQAWPDKPLKLVAPYAAGGSADQIARLVADALRAELGQPVVVENRPGGNASIAATQVATAAPDGYTLLVSSGASLVLNPLLYKKLNYDAQRDFTPVSVVASLPLVVVVSPEHTPVRSLTELIALAKAQPGKLNYATVGIGNPLHLATELFMSMSGTDMLHVPYNGSAPALTALLAGDVHVMFDASSTALPQVKAGKLRALAVTATERFKPLPDVPTVAESGFPGYEAGIWFGLAAPSQTPPERIALLNRAINKALANKAFRERLEATGVIVQAPRSTIEVGAFVLADLQRWREIIRAKRISLDTP
jgi:tripartite-type tricarboxylate transporter receptor subunit TctC